MKNCATYVMQDQVRQKIPDLMKHTYRCRHADRRMRNALIFTSIIVTVIALNLLAGVLIS